MPRLEQPRVALLEQRDQGVDLDLEATKGRRLGVEVGRQPVHQRGEEREGDGLLVAGDAEHHRGDEVHRLRVAPVGPEHAPSAEDAAECGDVRGRVGLSDAEPLHQ